MKIVINDCYGGFDIRNEIVKELGLLSIDSEDTRTNPELVKMIETGEDISGDCAKLKIVEIPDNYTDYYIDEHDGYESLIYVVDGKLYWT